LKFAGAVGTICASKLLHWDSFFFYCIALGKSFSQFSAIAKKNIKNLIFLLFHFINFITKLKQKETFVFPTNAKFPFDC
jgi:hypothetical protein